MFMEISLCNYTDFVLVLALTFGIQTSMYLFAFFPYSSLCIPTRFNRRSH